MRVNGSTRQSLGPWSPNMVRTIADAVNAYNDERTSLPAQRVKIPTFFLARITGNTAISGKTATVGGVAGTQVAWTYDWEEVSMNTSGTYQTAKDYRRKSSLVSGTLGKAYNGAEGPQTITATTTLGPGITTANIPAGYTIKAIANDTVVLMYALSRDNGEPLFFFCCPNAIDGICT